MKKTVLLVLLAGLSWIASSRAQGDEQMSLVRRTRFGDVRGKAWDEHTLAWLGVPYASPPTGALRWKAPRPPEPWSDVLEADHFRSACVQYSGLLLNLEPETYGKPIGEEDCLYLNVWRPDTDEKKLPVFFWLHGGLNVVGESATSLYHGANLARACNIVVVTINYRLGILGWFASEALKTGNPLDDSGDYGLLDMIGALTWVRENIEAFGGDPERVTIAGESAGGYNVVSLLGTPLANGLFHRAIAMSPLTSLYSVSMKKAFEKAEEQTIRLVRNEQPDLSRGGAKRLIKKKGGVWLADYLRSRHPAELLAGTVPLASKGLNDIGITMDSFGGSRFRDGTVVPLDFEARFKRGDFNRVPLIIGSNTDEMRIFEIALGIFSKPDERALAEMIRFFDPEHPSFSESEVVSSCRKPFYRFLGTKIGNRTFEKSGVDPAAKLVSPYRPVYVYKFGWAKQPAPFDFLVGASHMMALPFMFGNFQTNEASLFRFAWSRENGNGARVLSEAMARYLAGFVRMGDPNDVRGDLPAWETWSNHRRGRKRLFLDTSISMVDD